MVKHINSRQLLDPDLAVPEAVAPLALVCDRGGCSGCEGPLPMPLAARHLSFVRAAVRPGEGARALDLRKSVQSDEAREATWS